MYDGDYTMGRFELFVEFSTAQQRFFFFAARQHDKGEAEYRREIGREALPAVLLSFLANFIAKVFHENFCFISKQNSDAARQGIFAHGTPVIPRIPANHYDTRIVSRLILITLIKSQLSDHRSQIPPADFHARFSSPFSAVFCGQITPV